MLLGPCICMSISVVLRSLNVIMHAQTMRIPTRLPNRNNHPLPAAIQRIEPVLLAIRVVGIGAAMFVGFSLVLVALQGGPRF